MMAALVSTLFALYHAWRAATPPLQQARQPVIRAWA